MIECLRALSYLIFAPNLENKHYHSILYMSKRKFRENLMKEWFGVGDLSLCPDSPNYELHDIINCLNLSKH